jgi:hypothetical protein
MSLSDSRLNFYVVQVSSSNYNLHNINTDNKVLSLVTSEELRDFLVLNDPDHPFLFFNQEADDFLSYVKSKSPLTDRLMSRADTNKDYHFFDPFYTSVTSSLYNQDYNLSYTSDGYPPSIDDKQLSFSFASKNESKNQEKLSDKTENVLPFMPDDSWHSEEED